jgi:putative spermidine/putrescine transport system permease protein
VHHYTTKWFSVAGTTKMRTALRTVDQGRAGGDIVALVLGSAAHSPCTGSGSSDAKISLCWCPARIAGDRTGIALQSFFSFNGVNLSLITIIIGHTTFCIVVIYNNGSRCCDGRPAP